MLEKKAILHHSQQKCYRNPVGAVSAKTRVRLRLDITAAVQASAVILRVWRENIGELLIHMTKMSIGRQGFKYTCELEMPETGELIWYYFIIREEQKTFYYGNNAAQLGGEGAIYAANPLSFQITVYSEGAVTPDWFKNAVMYQIFPDRFYRSGNTAVIKKGAVIHSSWENEPFYFRDPDTKKILAYDFFGGNLVGLREKLSYLQDLGISAIYLNPIFESVSNHRYDTGDYHKVDPMLGTNEQFAEFCREARQRGIRVIIDGVFSHTGSDSKYFNRENHYPQVGAFQSAASPYYEWYNFQRYPYEYESWWGFETLPNVKETTPSYMEFIINGEESVLKYWLKHGISGWRLDVLDELPAAFSQRFYQVLKEENPDAVLIGEVWEDASNKVSYGTPRDYLCGKEIDSAMNYPFRQIAIDFALEATDAEDTNRKLLSLRENYPQQNFYAMMNLIGSHDVERILTVLGEALFYEDMPQTQQAKFRLSGAQYHLAVARLKLLSLWQMTFPGVPCIYYGDEAGMQGFRDPYNRGAYVWGKEDHELQSWYKQIIALRNRHQALKTGAFIPVYDIGHVYGYVRRIFGGRDVFGTAAPDETFLILLNRSREEVQTVTLHMRGICQGVLRDVLGSGASLKAAGGQVTIHLNPLQTALYQQMDEVALRRGAGVLMHPTALYSDDGIGDFGKSAYEFVNFLSRGGQKYWQVLPLNPVGAGDSPYQSPSAFAGNPMLISLGRLVLDGLLTERQTKAPRGLSGGRVDFAKAWSFKESCLRLAYRKFLSGQIPVQYGDFCRQHAAWLDDYTLFMALQEHFGGANWTEWEPGLARREPEAMAAYRSALADAVGYHQFLQYQFFRQWQSLKHYANHRGIQIIGDMPIFVAHNSADVWANQSLFALDEAGRAEKVAGVPPDYFSQKGQLWGNPQYRWDRMKEEDYAWWRGRFAVLMELADLIRVDHFRGFEAYWEVDGAAEDAIVGTWVKGPGEEFFVALQSHFGKLPIIAEDLGIITDAVNDLKDAFAFPGMKVLHFQLEPDEDGRVSFRCEQNCVVYTGTHDNNTTVGWLREDLSAGSVQAVAALLHADAGDAESMCQELIRFAYESNGAAVIIPAQDLLAADSGARMNLPGTVGGNWQWRAPRGAFSCDLSARLAALCRRYNR